MTVSLVASTSGTTTITLPTHQRGDLILIWCIDATHGVAIPSDGSWSYYGGGGDATGTQIFAKIAESSAETFDGTGFKAIVAASFRSSEYPAKFPCAAMGIGGQDTTGTTIAWSTSPSVYGTSDYIVLMAAHQSTDTSIQTAPTGYTNINSANGTDGEIAMHRKDTAATSFASVSQVVGGTSNDWATAQASIVELDVRYGWEAARHDFVLSDEGRTANSIDYGTGFWNFLAASRTARGVSGKYYFELSYDAFDDGNPITMAEYASGADVFTIGDASGLGGTVGEMGLSADNTTLTVSLGAFNQATDVVCFAIDYDNGKFWGRINNGNWNASGTANPATNTGGLTLSSTALQRIHASVFSFTGSNSFTLDSNEASFAYTPPAGFDPWDATYDTGGTGNFFPFLFG